MTELVLSPGERQALKARAHGLDPVVLLGAQGLTEAVVREIDRALAAHELIKVRVPGDDRDERVLVFTTIADRLSAARVQMIGKLLVLFRPQPEPEETAPPRSPRRAPAPGAPSRGAPSRGAPSRGAPSRGAPSRGAPSRSAPSRGAPSRGARPGDARSRTRPGDARSRDKRRDR